MDSLNCYICGQTCNEYVNGHYCSNCNKTWERVEEAQSQAKPPCETTTTGEVNVIIGLLFLIVAACLTYLSCDHK